MNEYDHTIQNLIEACKLDKDEAIRLVEILLKEFGSCPSKEIEFLEQDESCGLRMKIVVAYLIGASTVEAQMKTGMQAMNQIIKAQATELDKLRKPKAIIIPGGN